MINYLKNLDLALVAKLALLQVAVIMLSNYLVSIPAEAFGIKITYAAFTFPIVILATDLTVRLLGKGIARSVIAVSYPFAILGSIAILLLSGAPESVALRIGTASATAYLVGSLIDVFVFQKIRDRWTAWWPAPLFSTIVANIIDSYTFFAVAFYNSADPYMAAHWFEIATTENLTKIAIGIIVFLPIYGVLLNLISKFFKKDQSNEVA